LLLATYPGLDFYPANGGGDGIISEYEAKNYAIPNDVMELHFTDAQASSGISFTGLEFFNFRTLKLISDRQGGALVHGVNLDLKNINNADYITTLYLEKVYIDALDFKHAVNIKNLTFINCGMNLVLDDLPLLGTLARTTWNNASNLINLTIDNSGNFGTLDLTSNTKLTSIECQDNLLGSLDVSKNVALTKLDCSLNTINSLDVSANTLLQWLNCGTNALTKLDFHLNTALSHIDVNNNNLTSLDLTFNTKLQTVTVSGNASLTNIILPDGANVSPKGTSSKVSVVNSTLETLDLSNNALTSLDLHNYSKLTTIKVNNNNLTYLNVQNGNNQNINAANFDASGNTGLTEIIVDDIAYATANWPAVDAGITFISSTLGVADIMLNTKDIMLNTKIAVYPNPTRGLLNVAPSDYTIEQISVYSVTGKQLRAFNRPTKLVNLRNLLKGVYFIRIKTDKGALTKKIVKY
jgi:Secretion system C-terminal sorting domain